MRIPDPTTAPRGPRPWQRRLQRFFDRMDVELTIGVLIVVSVALTMFELALPAQTSLRLTAVNDIVTCLFATELTLRAAAATSKRRFLREFWIDIVAVVPLLRPLRIFRLVRLLRLLRLLRILTRRAGRQQAWLPANAINILVVAGLSGTTILMATGVIMELEADNPAVDTFPEALGYSLFTLLAGEPTYEPQQSLGGQLTTLVVMFMGMTVFAVFTGTVSAMMVSRLSREGALVDWSEFNGHTIICGWSHKAEIIVREHRAAGNHTDQPIVVITENTDPQFVDANCRQDVQFLHDDFTKVSALEKAGIDRASTCIILADRGQGRTEQDSDARTILAALTVEKLKPDIYTCAELYNREYGTHLEMGGVNDYVVTVEQNGFLLAQAALNRGLMGVFSELLTHERGNQFYRVPLTDPWIGKTFEDLFIELKRRHQAILLAIYYETGEFQVNPTDFVFRGGEHLIVISQSAVKL